MLNCEKFGKGLTRLSEKTMLFAAQHSTALTLRNNIIHWKSLKGLFLNVKDFCFTRKNPYKPIPVHHSYILFYVTGSEQIRIDTLLNSCMQYLFRSLV